MILQLYIYRNTDRGDQMNIGVLSVLLRKSFLYRFLILIESGEITVTVRSIGKTQLTGKRDW